MENYARNLFSKEDDLKKLENMIDPFIDEVYFPKFLT